MARASDPIARFARFLAQSEHSPLTIKNYRSDLDAFAVWFQGANGELGRVAKTLYLLNYLDDEAYRRRILTQLNRGESRHGVARVIFHGQRGELRQRYREGQEDQLGALGLMVNAVVLWNTRYLDAALAQVRASGLTAKPEDVERLSPLLIDHINVLGRYEFALKESIRQGQLRPLRKPDELDDLAA
jgi:hypothetical protein